ncbi:hypothetical protein BJF79_27745 [Actinomadura sp. CNU-125]|uniref:hypothetical protein n=1 Tax=Actinomadura sp. CNU-125 TaxID=1904961 RepID=UPI0009685F72|nr:hypothetical protein [Actinomadura sp. CNU-125]OLT38229.1 hypothetical protein BJF79_27745 [Actinomadura sp. CNU-125]
MIAIVRFQAAAYVRSLRILPPLIVIALVVVLVLLQGPSGPKASDLAVGTFGDVAAFMFPVWAWAARGLLDTQPDEQRALTTSAARHRSAPVWAGLSAAYLVNLGLGLVALAVPLVHAVSLGSPGSAVAAGCALNALAAVAGTLLGAWTSRAVLPSSGTSLLVLIGGAAALVLFGLGPLSPLSVPMIDWLRAAHDGPDTFAADFPGIALHLALWAGLVGAAYVATDRFRS